MVDAFTWQRGSESRTFSTRKELYDHMVERGDLILEGDDAARYKAHAEKMAAKGNAAAIAALAKME